jgi:transposase
MSDRRYKQGMSRDQGYLLPPHIEDYVSSANPVRAIDAYVDSLDLAGLDFVNAQGGVQKGQPAYSPSDLLKLYLYGYLHRVHSSRRLESETHRNLEVMWLLKGLRPSYKTIADFRKVNHKALKSVNRDFVMLCKELDLYGGELVGIDGSFFTGNAGRGSVFTASRLRKQREKIEADIERYLEELEHGDEREAEGPGVEDGELQEKLARLRERQKRCQDREKALEDNDATQLSETDPDARLLTKSGQSTVGYNVQCAVDAKHKLLVSCDVVTDRNDRGQLHPMARRAKEVLGVETLTVVADSGYYKQTHLKACEDDGITPYVAIPEPRKTERFSGKDFRYEEDRDAYRCPAGEYLERQSRQTKGDTVNFKYAIKASICGQCSLKERCLPKKTPYRQIYRYEHEEVVVAHRARMAATGRAYMKQRAALVEHPFGTLKSWCGRMHFLLRGLAKVRAEMSLLMLSYNFKRVLTILGVEAFRAYCLRRKALNRRHSFLFYLFACRLCAIKTLWNRIRVFASAIELGTIKDGRIQNQPI